MKSLKVIVLTLLIVGCAPIQVTYDYDRTTRFEDYKTYSYYVDMNTGLSELDTKRLIRAIDSKMTAKGFRFSDTPDFFIDIKSREYLEGQRSAVGVGLGGGGGNVGGGISIGIPVGGSRVNRQIIIDFVDENKRQLFWQAVSESNYNPNAIPGEREERLNAIVEKVFLEYPPQQ